MEPQPPQATDLPLPTHQIATTNQVQPRSTESSPKSTQQGEWDEPLAALPGTKLRLMCSYGGHIIPRPHDKSLSYVGGETRMVTMERNSTLQNLVFRLSKTLLDGRQFTLKYQLPNEELDSLISVSTNEDLENMVEEYDRIASSLKPISGRLRLFMFFAKPETSMTMGALLDDAKSETWFVDALNGADLLPRGLSSSAVDDLLSLGSGVTDDLGTTPIVCGCSDASKQVKISTPQDVQSMMPDSPMIETTTSSFDSSTSSPSMAHLPPIRVREEPGGTSLEEQLSSQMRLTPPLPTTILTQTAIAAASAGGFSNEINYLNRVISDDEKSDQGGQVPSRKPPLPLPLQHGYQRFAGGFNLPSPDSKNAGGFSLPSPDSITSDNSIVSPTSFSKVVPQQEQDQDQVTLNENNPPNTEQKLVDNPTIPPSNQTQLQPSQDPTVYLYPPSQHYEQKLVDNPTTPPSNQTQLQPSQDPTVYLYPPSQHYDQQQHLQHQYIQPNMHYIPTHAPLQSYYPTYQTTQQSIQPQVDHQNSQYPLYIVNQTHPYNIPTRPGPTESTVTSSAPQSHHPVYQTRAPPPTNNPSGMVQVAPHSTQYHHYLGPYNPVSGGPMQGNPVTYGNYDYSRDIQQQVYYTGQVPAGSQYQSMTPAQAAMIAEASMQLPTTDSNNQPPRTS